MATTDVRTTWQRTGSTWFPDDTVRAPRLAHCPSLPKPHPEPFHYEIVRGGDQAPSCYWSTSWSSLDTKSSAWQLSPGALCDHRSDCVALDEYLGSRCSLKPAGLQALTAERTSTAKLSPGMMGVTASEYATGAELELEWQLIVDPKPKSGLSASFRAAEAKTRLTEDLEIDTVVERNNVSVESISSITKTLCDSALLTKTFRESEGVFCPGSMSEEREPESLNGKFPFEVDSLGKYLETRGKSSYGSQSFCLTGDASPSTMTSSMSWRTANKEALVALVAQKAKERLENCDLPTPLSRSVILKGPLESCDLMIAGALPESMESSFDSHVMNSILRAGEVGEPTRIERPGIPASPIVPDNVETSYSAGPFARVSLPLNIPTNGQASSAMRRGRCQSSSFADNRQASWMAGEKAMSASSLCKSSGPLGEALCHSQTRAREAEKRAEESFQNYQKVANLFFREASLSLAYRQWVGSLQAENARLKMFVHRYQQATAWLQPSVCSPLSVLERFTECRWNTHAYGTDHARRLLCDRVSLLWPAVESNDNASFVISGEGGAEIIMGCTLSFAFALGLGLAGAGLMLGWSMGWILLAK